MRYIAVYANLEQITIEPMAAADLDSPRKGTLANITVPTDTSTMTL